MHIVHKKWQRNSLATLGMVASSIFLAASMFANFRYGFSLARTVFDGYLYGSAAAAGDFFMAAAPFFFFTAWRARNWTQALVSAVVWITMTAFAALAAISHASVNRMDAVSTRTTVATSYEDVRSELKQARADRGFVPQHRPEATVKAEIEKLKSNRSWANTSECTEPTASGKGGREFCAQYQTLVGELGSAIRATKLDERIANLVERSDRAASTNTSVGSEADPAAKTLSTLTGYSVREMQSFGSFAIAFVILLGAGFGFYMSWSVLDAKGEHGPDFAKATAPKAPDAASVLTQVEQAQVDIIPPLAPAATLQLPKPAEPLAATPAPLPDEPAPEWRVLLDAMDFPRRRPAGPLRPKDSWDVAGWRFFVWLCAYGHIGRDIPADKIDRLYEEFVLRDHRETLDVRRVKGKLSEIRKWVSKADSKSPTLWTITAPSMVKLRELLDKRKVVSLPMASKKASAAEADDAEKVGAPANNGLLPAKAEAGGNVVPLASAASGAAAPQAGPVKPVQGRAELQRIMPDLEGMWRLERQNKLAWQAKGQNPSRHHIHRFSRARAA